MSLVFGMLIFFVMTSMISDFSSVLLDIRDSNILYPKPIDRKTVSAAKLIHIIIYLSLLTVALVGPSLIAGLIKNGILFFLVGLMNVILIDMLIVALTALVYLLILKFFDGEKLKDIINYVQIGLSFAIMIGYQLLVRAFDIVELSVTFEPAWWQVLVFPIWYGVIMELVMNGGFQPFFLFLAGLGIFIPILAIWIYVRLTPAFERNLQKLSHHGKSRKEKRWKAGEYFSKLICPSNEERVFYRFARLMLIHERDFKLKVYPTLGFSIVIPFIFIMTGLDGFSRESFASIRNGSSYLTIYFSLVMIPTVISHSNIPTIIKELGFTKQHPLQSLACFQWYDEGVYGEFIFTVYLLISAVFVAIFGLRIIPDLTLIFVSALNFSILCFATSEKSLPFSQSYETYSQGNGAIVFLLMLVVALFAGVHYISTLFPYGLYIYLGWPCYA